MKVLVLAVRGLQAGALGCYGNPWIDTPALDRLAASACVFDWHLADAADPAGARRAWRTGRYALPGPAPAAAAPSIDLLELLRRQGISTCLLVDTSHPVPPEFTAGWDTVEHVALQGDETHLEAMLRAFEPHLEALGQDSPQLVWLDLATPLPPWSQVPASLLEPYFEEEELEEEEGEEDLEIDPLVPLPDPVPGLIDREDDTLFLRLQGTCAGAVSLLDAALAPILEQVADDVCIVLTADTGQNLGEHGLVGPLRPWLHEELVHLPLILRLPRGSAAIPRVDALTQAVDLAPTLASLFGLTLADVHGHDLLPLARGEIEHVRPYALSGLEVDQGIEWSLRTLDYVFLYPVVPHPDDADRGLQLYVKPDDRWEVNNVVQHHLDLADQLALLLRAVVAAAGQPGPLSLPPLPES